MKPRGDVTLFTHRSIVAAPVEELFRWHERPEAILDLMPMSRWARIESQSGGIRDGGRITFSVGVGPLRMRWEARHFGYVRAEQFCDEQVRGPFKVWRHTHRFEAIDASQSLYEDRVEYAVPGGRLVQRLTARPLGYVLSRAFAQRHAVVRAAVAAVLAVLVICATPVFAQDTAGVGTLRGHVTDSAGARVRDAAVCVPATSQCTVSDAEGNFVLSVRPGTYALEIAAPGQPLVVTDNVQVRAGLDGILDIVLPALDGLQQTVTVTAPLFVRPEEVKTSSFLIAPRQIAGSAGALQDVSRYVQALPGVVIGTNDFRNDLIVRGGSPLENLYIVDNVEIPNINTFANFASAGGTVSILDVQLIDSVTFLTGGYPAPFGNRTSSVLQIAQREGRRDRVGGMATVGFAGAGGVVEGPIGSAQRSKGSWIVSARRSFLDVFTDDTGIGGVPVLYTLNGKAVYDLSARDRIWVVNLTGVDTVRLGLTDSSDLSDELSNLDIQYEGWRSATGFNWQRTYKRGVGLLGISYARATVGQRVADLLRNGVPPPDTPVEDQIAGGEVVFREESSESDTTVKYDLSVSIPFLQKMQVGGSVKASHIDYDAESPFGTDSPFFPVADANPFSLRETFTAFQSSAYVQATRPVLGRLTATVGARVDHYPFLSATRVSPRLGAEYPLTPRLALQASYGRYYQQPFFLFLEAYPENSSLGPFAADHYVGGITFDVDRSTRASVEAYRKDYRDYPVSSQIPSLSLANVGDTFAIRDVLFPMISAGTGTVSGVEVTIDRRAQAGSPWNGQANLAFSRARYAGLDGVPRPGSFDYPVVANLLGGYQLSPAWSVSVKMAYLGGRPFTPVDSAISTLQRRAVYDLSRVNAERSPDYFRLDLRVDRTFRRGDHRVSIFAGAQNITNRKNFAGYSWDRRNNVRTTQEQLGLFPILGIEWPF
jgi:ligand-binding SRPBCC domain-containing protein